MFWARKKIPVKWANQAIPLSTPLEKVSFTVFDCETTGFNVNGRDRMIEIGAVLVKDLTVQDITFHSLINPGISIPPKITELTGISNELTHHAPHSLEAIQAFFRFMEDHNSSIWVGHYVPFDVQAIKSELKKEKYHLSYPLAIDTLSLLRLLHPYQKLKDLEQYALEYETPVFSRHTALGDALTTAYLFIKLLKKIAERGVSCLGDLSQIITRQNSALLLSSSHL